jgi:GR25 family glycosyltransferase involved in LPS biosynthesis
MNFYLILGIFLIIFLVILFLLYFITRPINIENLNNNNHNNNYLDGIDVIYWINLDRATERRNNMEKILEYPVFGNIEKIRYPAIDGSLENFQDIIMKTIYPRNYRCNFTNQEYACLFSHLNVIKKFSNSNYEVALIIEDDITLEYKKYWKQNVRQIMENAPKDWEIIQLGYTIGIYNKIPEELYILNVDRKFYGTGAYIIKKSSAKNFIQNLIKGDKYLLNKNIPYTADIYIYKMLKTYVYKYPYFTYPTNNDSYIHNEHLPDHFRSKELTNSLYKS